jgi:prepilin-type N-terminal cleavage/methylation domain-containing protein
MGKIMGVVRRKRGFTLVEMLLAMIIISVLVAAMSQLLIVGLDSYRLVVDRREALQKARLAMNMMVAELTTIADPATKISSISPTAISFANASDVAVTYQISGSNLLRNSKVLAPSIAGGSGFQYYKADGNTANLASDVHRMKITLVVNSEETSHGNVTLISDVYLRNRYYVNYTRQ